MLTKAEELRAAAKETGGKALSKAGRVDFQNISLDSYLETNDTVQFDIENSDGANVAPAEILRLGGYPALNPLFFGLSEEAYKSGTTVSGIENAQGFCLICQSIVHVVDEIKMISENANQLAQIVEHKALEPDMSIIPRKINVNKTAQKSEQRTDLVVLPVSLILFAKRWIEINILGAAANEANTVTIMLRIAGTGSVAPVKALS
jgi:hypothetical protein